jgi:hypothetical protein
MFHVYQNEVMVYLRQTQGQRRFEASREALIASLTEAEKKQIRQLWPIYAESIRSSEKCQRKRS